MINTNQQKHLQLIQDGFCVFEKVLDPIMLGRVRAASDCLLDAQPPEHFEAQKSTGSMISVYTDPFFAELVAYQPTLKALVVLNYPKPRWSSGYIISKPPQSPPLFWHQDWWGWNDPISYDEVPQQLFLMYYLVDTNQYNGCLRVIQGSHRKRHLMHDAVPEAHAANLNHFIDPTHQVYQSVPEELVVPVKAGDLVIGDSRLLHGSYANQSNQRRTVITLWYHPAFDTSPGCIRAHLSRKQTHVTEWPESAQKLVRTLVPTYDGDAEPLVWNRTPGAILR
ncbi:TPA: phytanoyl-CoA dioxygenase [Candidatus Poribacteria bacterium]|nr:phytanoyl-CoA dioxygenase [Candidatus Poribacteria bacterium]